MQSQQPMSDAMRYHNLMNSATPAAAAAAMQSQQGMSDAMRYHNYMNSAAAAAAVASGRHAPAEASAWYDALQRLHELGSHGGGGGR